MKLVNSLLEGVISIICAITLAVIIIPLHLVFAPLARKQLHKEQSEDGR